MATIQKLPSGKYRVQVRRNGIYRAKTFTTKTLATQWGANLEAQIESSSSTGLIAPPQGMTIGNLIEGYCELEPKLKWGRTKSAVLKRLKTEFKNTTVKTFNQVHIRDFLDGLIADGTGGSTCAQYLSVLGSVLSWAHHSRRINIDPNLPRSTRASLTHQGMKLKGRERSRTPTKKELEQIFDEFKTNELIQIPMADITTLAIETAMRLSEICGLIIEDCNWEARTVMIRDRKSPHDKHGNNQTIPISAKAVEALQRHAGERVEGRVFPDLNHRSVSARFTRTITKLKIDDLHFHDLRHYALTNFANMGLSLPELSLISGHRSFDMLKRYVNLKASDLANKI